METGDCEARAKICPLNCGTMVSKLMFSGDEVGMALWTGHPAPSLDPQGQPRGGGVWHYVVI